MTKRLSRVAAFAAEHKWALIVLALLLVRRVMALYCLRFTYSLQSDDTAYVTSGITFANTGMITMHEPAHPSAQIMPGMTVLIGLFSFLFGEGDLLWAALKLLWICMGTLTAWFVYRCVRLFCPAWCGVVGMLPFFRSDIVWMDNTILTETPFMLALTAMVYYTLKMAKEPGWPCFWCCLAAYMAGLMLKANIAPYPLLALAYLLFVKYDRKLLLRQCAVLAGVVLCFVIPWSIRNYIHFHAFIPLTYGAGNPTLMGTYQGMEYPEDEELDYETNVEQVAREKYADYYDENGKVKPGFRRYVALGKEGIKAAYRQKMWAQKDFKRMAYSYLIMKPQMMIDSIFYGATLFDESKEALLLEQRIDLRICIAAIAAALILKNNRRPVLFVAGVYLVNIYIYAMTFAFSRYNASLMSMRFILVGLGSALILGLIQQGMETLRAKGRGSPAGRTEQAVDAGPAEEKMNFGGGQV